MRRLRTHRTCQAAEYPPPPPIDVPLVDHNATQTDSLVVTMVQLSLSDENQTQLDTISVGNNFGLADANLGQTDALLVTVSPAPALADSNATQADALAVVVRLALADSNATQADALGAGTSFALADSNATQTDALALNVKPALVDSNATQTDAMTVSLSSTLSDSNATQTDSLTVNVVVPPPAIPQTLWVKAGDYTAGTGVWLGSPSPGGTSGVHPLGPTAGYGTPVDGVVLNGKKTVRFTLVRSPLSATALDSGAVTLNDFLATASVFTNWTASFLVCPAALSTVVANTSQDIATNPSIFGCKSASYWGCVLGKAGQGFTGFLYGGPYEDASGGLDVWAGPPIVVGTWYKVQVRYTDDGINPTKLECRVNGGAWLTFSPCPHLNGGALTQILTMGAASIGAAFTGLTADVAEASLMNFAVSDAVLNAFNAYYLAAYGV